MVNRVRKHSKASDDVVEDGRLAKDHAGGTHFHIVSLKRDHVFARRDEAKPTGDARVVVSSRGVEEPLLHFRNVQELPVCEGATTTAT